MRIVTILESAAAMAHRTIHDDRGVEWQVWDTIPAKRVSQTFESGWLTFESVSEKRRLAPLPLYWFKASEAELLQMLDLARPVDQPRERRASREST